MSLKYVFLFFLALGISCEQKNDPNPEVPQSVIDKTLTYFEGEVIEKDFEDEDGVDAWIIKIQNTQGAIVKFYWTSIEHILLKIEGQSVPFDYEIMPGNSLVNYSSAKTIAIGAVKNENISGWELEKNEDFIGNWVYAFKFDDDGQTVFVFIDALNGNILEID